MSDKNFNDNATLSFNDDEKDFLQQLDQLEVNYNAFAEDDTFTSLEDENLMNVEFLNTGELRVSEVTINSLKQAMKDTKILGNEVALFEEEVVFNKKALIKLLREPVLIEYDYTTDSLKFLGENGKEVNDILNDIESIKPADADQWLCQRLPDPTFSTTYSNDRRMEKEARAVYKLVVYASICKTDWMPEFLELLRNYDFEKLVRKDEGIGRFNNFSDMLSFVSSNARLIGKYVLSACNTKFIKQKKPTDPGFASLLTAAEASELEKLGIMRNNLIKASKAALQNVEMSWEKGQINYELKVRLDNIFNGNYDDSDVFGNERSDDFFKGASNEKLKQTNTTSTHFKKTCGLLFKASLLNTEVLSEADVATINRIVNRIARRELNVELNKIVPQDIYQDFKNLVAKLKKVAVKLRVAQYKRDAVSKIRGAKDNLDNVLIRSKR